MTHLKSLRGAVDAPEHNSDEPERLPSVGLHVLSHHGLDLFSLPQPTGQSGVLLSILCQDIWSRFLDCDWIERRLSELGEFVSLVQ